MVVELAQDRRDTRVKTVSANLKAHFAQQYQTTRQCVRVELKDGTILRFTDHDQDVVISGWSGRDAPLNGTYLAASGYFASDVQTTSDLAVANMELHGPLTAASQLDADVAAGLWDFAAFTIFRINWQDLTASMGPYYVRVGRLGEISTQLGTFKDELRGLAQAYTNTLCEVTSPLCRANLGDARCTVSLAPFTVTGTVTSVNADNQTFYDTSRTEPGPTTASVAITGISNANPGVVTMADGSLNLSDGQAVVLSGIVGPGVLNAVTVAHNPSGNTFQLSVDTTDTSAYPPYISGGTVTLYGGSSGYFDYGVLTWTSGNNNGLKQEVKQYLPGQITLVLPMPYAIQVGDHYSMHAGCDRVYATCRDRFSNYLNFRGEYKLPGTDKLIQVGRHQ
jgi:hypothetical protein